MCHHLSVQFPLAHKFFRQLVHILQHHLSLFVFRVAMKAAFAVNAYNLYVFLWINRAYIFATLFKLYLEQISTLSN